MIIAISGKIASGKDEVAKMIQYLSFISDRKMPELSYESYLEHYNLAGKWEIKKFGGKLKDITCILLGCTREELENRDFKDSYLSKEWNRKWVYDAGWDKEWTAQSADSDYKEPVEKLTIRRFMQIVGTEAGRKMIHPDIWVNALMADYNPYIEGHPQLVKSNGEPLIAGNTYSMGEAINPNWVISDLRFPNEIKSIKKKNGITIRLERESCFKGNHYSETALDDYKDWDYVIHNNGTIEELGKQIEDIIVGLNLH